MTEQLTEKEFQRLQAKLEELEGPEMRRAAEEIARARGFGDIAENAEYHAAKDEQARLFERIVELRERLLRAEVVKPSRSRTVVGLGSVVAIQDSNRKKMTLRVGNILDATGDVVTPNSPLGKALIGAKVGDTVEVEARVKWKAKILSVRGGS